MFTYLGKLLVLLNAFGAVAVLAWAVSAYVTKFDPNEAVDVTGEKLTDKVKRLDSAALTAQKGYAPELARVANAEYWLFDVKEKIDARLQQAETGSFFDIYESTGTRANPNDKDNPVNPNPLDRVDRVVWTSDKSREIKGLDGKPLSGVTTITKQLTDEQTAAAESIAAMKVSVDELTALNVQIAALNDRYAWLDVIDKRHTAEIGVLVDLRVNWENRGGSLQRRRNQLIGRLEDLKNKASAVPPAPTGPSAFTLTPPAK